MNKKKRFDHAATDNISALRVFVIRRWTDGVGFYLQESVTCGYERGKRSISLSQEICSM